MIISLASGCGNISVNFLGTLSSNTTSEYHLEPNATNCIKIGNVSLPFSVSLHCTIIGDLFSSARSMKPFFSGSFKVDSIDEYSSKVEKLGGKVFVRKHTVPGMGYFALCRDTENNVFAIWETNESPK
jgi:hypothetical protein